ncbi:Cc-nbs-lrr resistance-like protein, partial [Theobroma cacao]
MTLQDLPQLISFCSEDRMSSTSQQEQGNTSTKPLFTKQIVFPQLTSLRLSSIKTQRIWHSQLSETYCFCLPNLKTIIIEGCHYLQHLLFPSVARNLVHLEQFEIVNCKCLREIIFTGEIKEEQEDVICFPQLNSLVIKDLQNLLNFCSGNYNIEFPLLKVLTIKQCPKLKEFISETKMEGKYESSIQALFNEKAAVPSLERMTLCHLRNVKKMFHDQLLAGSFGKLEEMIVECCDELLALFPSNVFGVLQSLKTLIVGRCDSLEQMFEVGVAVLNNKETHAVDSQLMKLYIYNLPKLKHVWNKDPQGSLTFQNLRKVGVRSCESLKNLFPASIAKDLPQLEYLAISRCGVEEIVSAGDGLEQPVRFEFPR